VEGLSQPTTIALNVVFWFGAVVCVASIIQRMRLRPPGASRFRTIVDGTLRPGERVPWLFYAGMALMFVTAVVLARA
jgi:hypothetical protein